MVANFLSTIAKQVAMLSLFTTAPTQEMARGIHSIFQEHPVYPVNDKQQTKAKALTFCHDSDMEV